MDDDITIYVIGLAIFGFAVIIVLLVYFFYTLRGLFYSSESRSKRRCRANFQGEFDNPNRVSIPLNDITPEESMPTESDNI